MCKHYLGFNECEAFPEKIPESIFTGIFDHTEPFKGDHGIQFEPLEDIKNENEIES